MSRLTRNNALIYLLCSLVISNVASLLHISALSIPMAFIFIFVPGFLSLAMIQKTQKMTIETFVLSFGIGLSVLMFIGLAVNSLHSLTLVEQPLRVAWILPAIDLYCFILMIIALKNNRLAFNADIQQGNHQEKSFVIMVSVLSLVLILFTYFGVNRLNNINSSAMIVTVNICACLLIFGVVILRRYLSDRCLAIILFTLSAVLLLTSSLRSGSVFGSDIINEFRIFNITNSAGVWSPTSTNNTYNLCLSITLLPQLLQQLTASSGLFVFKILASLLFSVCPIVVFLIAKHFLPSLKAFLAACSFVVFTNYINSMPNHVRQEFAFLFFALVLLIILKTQISQTKRNVFIVIFGLSMILSHYSTTYVSLMIFIGYSVSLKFIHIVRKKQNQRIEPFRLTPVVLIALVLTTVFWYSQLTLSAGGPIAYIKSAGTKFLNSQNDHAANTAVKDQFKLSAGGQESTAYAQYVNASKLGYTPAFVPTQLTAKHLSPSLDNKLRIGTELLKKLYKLMILISVPVLLVLVLRKRGFLKISDTYAALAIACMIAIAASFVIPSFTVDYDQERFFQQILLIVCIPFVAVWFLFLSKLKILSTYLLAIFFVGYVLVSSGIASLLIAGSPINAKFSNQGFDFGRYYVYQGELNAAKWAVDNRGYRGVYSDPYASNRVRLSAPLFSPQDTTAPKTIPLASFVYFDAANVNTGLTYTSAHGITFGISSPSAYYQANGTKLYSNAKAQVYEKKR